MQVQNCYRIKKDITGGVEVSTARLKELQPKTFTSPVQEATEYAARAIADAERKLLAAVDAKKEEERVSQMLDDATAGLEFARGLYEKCKVNSLISSATHFMLLLTYLLALFFYVSWFNSC